MDALGRQERELVPLYENKIRVQERLERIAAENSNFTWTSLVCGHFFDWGLKNGFLHFDSTRKNARIIDDGNKKSSLSTLSRIAEATIRVLKRDNITKNRKIFIQSFCVSQNECLESLKRSTGADWTVEYLNSEELIRKNKPLADAGNLVALGEVVFALGILNGNWEAREEFGMGLLGLENENLNSVVKQVVKSV